MRDHSLALAALFSFLPVATGCSSSYVPAASPRASLVMESGTYAYVRDGKKYEGGVFGGDIEEAVRGNERAEEYARAYKTGTATGLALSFVGVAAAIGGAVLLGYQAGQTTSGQSVPLTGLFIALGGFVVDLAGGIVVSNAQPHLFDAINAYNDGLLRQPSSPPPAHGPTSTPAPTDPAKVETPNAAPSGAARPL